MSEASSARIRLEGAWERLETSQPRLLRATSLLGERRWLTALRRAAHVLEAATADEAARAVDLERARSIGADAVELSRFVDAYDSARRGLLVRMTEKLGEKPASLTDGCARLLELVRTSLPGPARPAERTVAVISAEKPNEGALGIATVFGAPYLIALSAEVPDAIPWVIGGAGLALAGFVGRAVTTAVVSGTCTVTNERMVWRPRRGEARQCELKDVIAGSLRTVTPSTVELRAPDLIRMRLLESPSWAATAIAVQAAVGATVGDTERTCIPCFGAAGSGRTKARRGWAIIYRGGAVFWPQKEAKLLATSLLGYAPRFTVDLEAVVSSVALLPDAAFDAMISKLTAATGFTLSPTGITEEYGEVLFTGAQGRLTAKLTADSEARLRHAMELFRPQR